MSLASMSRPRRKSAPVRSRRAIKAAQMAQRNECLVRLYKAGETIAELAAVSQLSVDQVTRVLRDADAIPTGDTPLLTPAEKRELMRENASSPESVAWLIEQRTDARHNGRPMPRFVTNADDAFDDPLEN